MAVDWKLPVSSVIFLTVHVVYFDEVARCSKAYNYSILVNCIILFVMSAHSVLAERGVCRVFNDLFSTVWLMALPFNFILSLVLFLVHKTYSCLPQLVLRLDVGLLIISNLTSFMMLCIIGCYSVSYLKAARKVRKAKQELEQVYENILNPDYDAVAFLKKHGAALNSTGLSPKDFSVLQDNFAETFDSDQSAESEENRKECAICLDHYHRGDRVVCHPGCNHLFHWDCLGPWLEKESGKPQCPLCKKPTLTTMILAVRRMRVRERRSDGETERASLPLR